MSLLDDLENVSTFSGSCGVGKILAQLTPKEAQALNKAIDDKNVSMSDLARVLTANGYEINRKTIGRHRLRGTKDIGCVCP